VTEIQAMVPGMAHDANRADRSPQPPAGGRAGQVVLGDAERRARPAPNPGVSHGMVQGRPASRAGRRPRPRHPPRPALESAGANEARAPIVEMQRCRAALLLVVLLHSDAAGVDASICGREIVSAFADDRLEAERASGASMPHGRNPYQRGAAMWLAPPRLNGSRRCLGGAAWEQGRGAQADDRVRALRSPGRSEREVTSLSRRTRPGSGSTSRCVAAGTPTGFGTGDDVVLIDLGRRHVGSIVLR
jgi:hypothetical protein